MTQTPSFSLAQAPLHYHVSAPNPHNHLWHVTLTIAQPAAAQTLQMPVWIPGSYLVRQFSRHVQNLQATQNGHAVPVQQIDSHTWQVAASPNQPLHISYQIYAHDNSVREAWLDEQRGFINGTCTFLQVLGQEQQPHTVQLQAPYAHWRLATSLNAHAVDDTGFGSYTAPDYDTLVDCPIEMGDFWCGEFEVYGVKHQLVVSGATPAFDHAQLIEDTQRICQTAIDFWHPENPETTVPFNHYVFLLNITHQGYGGLEHSNSTALLASRSHLPTGDQRSKDYTELLGLISHEYFHTWNVKRLRPAALWPYRYTQENYTELLWFFEGFTSYYDDLLLVRADLLPFNDYLQLLSKTINQVQHTPGRLLHSLAQASFEAWNKYYRPDSNTQNITVSYYTKGALLACCLDLAIRQSSIATLDDVMRELYALCYQQGRGMTEADVLEVVRTVADDTVAQRLQRWIHDTEDLPLLAALQALPQIKDQPTPAPLEQQWGLRCKEGDSIRISHVLRDSAAEAAGMAAGDEWYGIELANSPEGWRIGTLAEVERVLPAQSQQQGYALVNRDRRLLRLPIQALGEPQQQVALQATPFVDHGDWPWK